MKILITGLNGFLGKNLVKFLKNKNYQILSIERTKRKNNYSKNFKVLNDNIENLKEINFKKIDKFGPKILLNLAWHGIPDFSYKNCKKNKVIHYKFLKKILKIKTINKIIMTGSCWEYSSKINNCTEDTKKLSTNDFATAKIEVYNFLKEICRKKNINLVWFRIFFMYGPHQKKQSLIPNISQSIKIKETPEILSPTNKNDFIFVGDVCNAIIKTFKNKSINGIFNLGSGNTYSVIDVYRIILKLFKLHKNKDYLINIKGKINNDYIFSNTKKIYKHLDWKPKINLVDGIKRTINN